MTVEELAYELGTRLPNPRARPYADSLAKAAFKWWPKNPRGFAWFHAAVIERETHWRNILGDNGHGHGLGQVDDRSWAAWLADHQNGLDPESNLDKSAEILAMGLAVFIGNLRAAAASYNTGAKNVRRGLALTPPNPDAHTTGGDYGRWVVDEFNKIKPVDVVFTT